MRAQATEEAYPYPKRTSRQPVSTASKPRPRLAEQRRTLPYGPGVYMQAREGRLG